MTSKDYKKIILDKIKEILKPRQFRKGGQAFKHSNGDLIYYVDLQSSKFSTATELKVTINIGIGSELLYKLEGKTITSYLRGHFSKRIGDYLSPAQDIGGQLLMPILRLMLLKKLPALLPIKF